jgi:hypothetical protein
VPAIGIKFSRKYSAARGVSTTSTLGGLQRWPVSDRADFGTFGSSQRIGLAPRFALVWPVPAWRSLALPIASGCSTRCR